MRKQERQVLENAIKTMNSVIEAEINREVVKTKFCVVYLRDSMDSLRGYASTQLRFSGMKEKDYDEFCNTLHEFHALMIEKIYR